MTTPKEVKSKSSKKKSNAPEPPKSGPPRSSPPNTIEKKGILRSLSFQFSNLTKRKNDYDLTPEEENGYDDMGPVLGVQCFGVLMKKYKRKNRPAKWAKRFFVLKECFLIYYATAYRKTFEKTRRIDLHPKGIIPLIGCSIVSGGDTDKKNCLLIAHPQFPSAIIIAAPDHSTQDKWLKALRNATKVSYKNTVVGETMIRELENRGVMLNEEKKSYEERLEAEARARKEEHDRADELAKDKEELEAEREKLIRTTKKLKDDLQNVKNELKMTNEMKKTLEQEKMSLNSKTEHLQANMESLNIEKEKIQDQLAEIVREREKVLIDNQNLSTDKCQLSNRLMEIETSRNCIMTEKDKIEMLLKLNEQKTLDLEKERQYYTCKTTELMDNLKEVNEQKELTESELKEQMMARIGAERQLQAAEKALEHLEMALKMTGAQMTELQEHIMPDVHKLREFFEQCAEDARFDANRTQVMRQAIYARKSIFDLEFLRKHYGVGGGEEHQTELEIEEEESENENEEEDFDDEDDEEEENHTSSRRRITCTNNFKRFGSIRRSKRGPRSSLRAAKKELASREKECLSPLMQL